MKKTHFFFFKKGAAFLRRGALIFRPPSGTVKEAQRGQGGGTAGAAPRSRTHARVRAYADYPYPLVT